MSATTTQAVTARRLWYYVLFSVVLPPLSSSLRGAVPPSAASGLPSGCQPTKAFSLNLFGGQFHGKRQSRPLVPVVSVTDHPVQHSRRERITRPDRAADAKSRLASEALLRGSGGPSTVYVSCGCAAPRPTGQHGASVFMSHGRRETCLNTGREAKPQAYGARRLLPHRSCRPGPLPAVLVLPACDLLRCFAVRLTDRHTLLLLQAMARRRRPRTTTHRNVSWLLRSEMPHRGGCFPPLLLLTDKQAQADTERGGRGVNSLNHDDVGLGQPMGGALVREAR